MPKMNNTILVDHQLILHRHSMEFKLPKEAMHADAGWGEYGIFVHATHPVTVVGKFASVNRNYLGID